MHTSSASSCENPFASGCLVAILWPFVSWLKIPVSFSIENVSRRDSFSLNMHCSFDVSGFSSVISLSGAWNCSVESFVNKPIES